MRTTSTILALGLVLGMALTPAAAAEGDDDPFVACTLELPPDEDSCEIDDQELTLVVCTLELPPSCNVADLVYCNVTFPPSANNCKLTA